MAIRIQESARIGAEVEIGDGTSIWDLAQVREKAVIGRECVIGRNVYVDAGVRIGNRVKIQNGVSVYHGVELQDGVFVGPEVSFTNDRVPRAVNPDMSLRGVEDWVVVRTVVKRGASLGANSTLICGVTVGEWAIVGAGSVVVADVPQQALVVGNPARVIGYVCVCGKRIEVDRVGLGCACGGQE